MPTLTLFTCYLPSSCIFFLLPRSGCVRVAFRSRAPNHRRTRIGGRPHRVHTATEQNTSMINSDHDDDGKDNQSHHAICLAVKDDIVDSIKYLLLGRYLFCFYLRLSSHSSTTPITSNVGPDCSALDMYIYYTNSYVLVHHKHH